MKTDITKWGIFWSAVKGAFSLNSSMFEGIVEYVLDVLNTWLACEGIADKVKRVHAVALNAYQTLVKYRGWCPLQWIAAYDKTLGAVNTVIVTFDDGRLEQEELKKCATDFREAYAEWFAENDVIEAKFKVIG